MNFLKRMDIELPIIQAPMAGVQDGALAIATCSAGGLGSLPCAMLDAEALHRELTAITHRTDRPYNVNFFCHAEPRPDAGRESTWRKLLAPYYSELGIDATAIAAGPGRAPFSFQMAEVLEIYRPPVISFHFGLPAPELLVRIRRWDPLIIASATTVSEATWLEDRGVDAIIVQGLEAGGHRGHFLCGDLTGQAGTFALLPRVLAAVKVPVIAAGGIADAAGVKAAMDLGAAAVQVGTAYLLCPEATTRSVHRSALGSDAAGHTAVTNLFSGRAARGIVNRLMRELGPLRDDIPEFPLAAAALAPLRAAAEAGGSGDFSPLWAGQNTRGCREVSAEEITRDLAALL